MNQYHRKKDQSTLLERLVLGVGRGVWWLVTLPFSRGKKTRGLNNIDRNYIMKKRSEIEEMLKSENIHETKQAVMEADKLVDFLMRKYGYAGESFADRLRSAEASIDHETYEKLWQGHKVRNALAHDSIDVGEQEMISAARKLLNYVRI
jgi:hypothetical protein